MTGPDTPGVTVLTPVHRPDPIFLDELHASLDAQAAVDWEWLIQVDGGQSLVRRVPGSIRADPRVAIEANGRWLGQAVTRNLALVRARHRLLQNADADDLLLPDALAAGAGALEAEPDLGLVFGRTYDLSPDGSVAPGKNLYEPGRLEPGALYRDWERRGGSCSISVASVMWRTACVDAAGGWPASVAGLDVLLLLAVNSLHPVRCLDADTYLYRLHPRQIHRSALRFEMRPRYRTLARRMIAARTQLGIGAVPLEGEAAGAVPDAVGGVGDGATRIS